MQNYLQKFFEGICLTLKFNLFHILYFSYKTNYVSHSKSSISGPFLFQKTFISTSPEMRVIGARPVCPIMDEKKLTTKKQFFFCMSSPIE